MTKKEQAELEAKKKAEEAAENADDDAQDEDSDDEEEEDSEDDGSLNDEDEEEKVDYKALADAEKERADKAEKALAADRYKASKKKRDGDDGDDDDEDNGDEDDADRPITAKDLQSFERRIVARTEKKVSKDQALAIARANTSSEDEAQAALVYWQNRVVPTGDVQEDVLGAIALMNRNKTSAKNSELRRALNGNRMAVHNSAGTHRDSVNSKGPKLSKGDEASYKRAGFTFDKALKAWTKKAPNGKILIKDPKTKQIRVL